ncbi:MAG TPA: glycosyltransferase family 9 protein [Longimicrobiales bacterium]|nr:glycosyltransferase family 9 protein [Longimicrobiales bacterium]
MAGPPDLIRTPNHLGDLIMALPALQAAPSADLVVTRWLTPLIALVQRAGDVIPLDRGRAGFIAAVRTLRRRHHESGVLLPPSFSSALLFRAAGVRRVRGAATDGRRLLLSEAIPREQLRDRHRTALYRELVLGTEAADEGVGAAPVLPVPAEERERWREQRARLRTTLSRGAAAGAGGPRVGIFPGSNAPSRRWDAERFAAVARGLAAAGVQVEVYGAPAERRITGHVAGDVALDAGGATDLPMLAAALSECDILVTNDSGPMHLAAAVGTRTLVVSGPADTRETAPGGSGHVYLQRLDLPCVPCVKNECPRSGAGFILPEAERECLRLIEVPEVLTAARQMLGMGM